MAQISLIKTPRQMYSPRVEAKIRSGSGIQDILGLLTGMFSKHANRYIRVLKSGPGEKEFAPQFIIHGKMVIRVEPAHCE